MERQALAEGDSALTWAASPGLAEGLRSPLPLRDTREESTPGSPASGPALVPCLTLRRSCGADVKTMRRKGHLFARNWKCRNFKNKRYALAKLLICLECQSIRGK